MSREIRSRRAGPAHDRPLYARALRLRHLAPTGFLCFVFLEGSVILAILLALAELVTWWGVLVLPVTVAVMVKLNDVIAGQLGPADPPVARLDRADLMPPMLTVRTRVDLSGYPTLDLSERRVPEEPVDAGVLNGPPSSRRWAEDLDRQVRQSVAHHHD